MSERLLVTGSSGFMGSNFVHHTLADHPGYSVTVVDATTYAANTANLEGLEGRIDFVDGDICNEALMDGLMARHDVVVNFAGESQVDNSLRDPDPFIRTNILGVYSLLKAVRKHGRRLHQVSSDEVFGDMPLDSTGEFTEESPYRPSSPYSATKASAEMLIRSWVRSFGVQATVSNCANIYGPRQHVEKFVPRQITNVLVGARPKLYGDGASVREWTHVDDHSAAVHRILEHGELGGQYIIGTEGGESSIRGVLMHILEIMGQPDGAFDRVPDRPGHDMRIATDATRLHLELGWNPQFSNLREGLAATVDWYKGNPDWWMRQKQAAEARYSQGTT